MHSPRDRVENGEFTQNDPVLRLYVSENHPPRRHDPVLTYGLLKNVILGLMNFFVQAASQTYFTLLFDIYVQLDGGSPVDMGLGSFSRNPPVIETE